MKRHTYHEIARNWDLWGQHVDPYGTMTRDAFEKLDVNEKISIIIELFGEEEIDNEENLDK